MNEQDITQWQQMMQTQLEQEQIRRMQAENNASRSSEFRDQESMNISEQQLNLDKELDRIYHLLSGHVQIQDSDGGLDWKEPTDDRLKIFSDYGVKQIMNIISFYINRNTLLSNFDEDQIYWKVRDFGMELADLVFNRYEAFFYYPTPEELFELYWPIVEKIKLNITRKAMFAKCEQWSREELQSKFRHYPMIILALVDTVHATFLRALNGEERESLRKQINIHQSMNTQTANPNTPPKTSVWERITH